LTDSKPSPPRRLKKKLGWFAAIWLASVLALLGVAMLIRVALRV